VTHHAARPVGWTLGDELKHKSRKKPKFWWADDNHVIRARDLCFSIGMRPPRGTSFKIPEWAIVIARLAGSAAHLRGVSHARIKLRRAAQLLHDDPELVDALLAAERLGGLPASRRSIIALVDDRPKPEELRAKVRARRLKLARDLLAMHKSRLRREERLVKKWAAKVRRLERSVELGDGDGSED